MCEFARYEIRVKRHLGAAIAALFPEFTLTESDGCTVMQGTLPDQAALHGVMTRIRDLGLTLVSLECLDAADCLSSFAPHPSNSQTTSFKGESQTMNKRVLVAYASKYGATCEIAERIGSVMQAHGLQADVLPAETVESLVGYDAVVLGSAVYAGSWRKDAAQLLTDSEAALRERPVWLFSSGPTGEGDASTLMKGWRFPQTLQPIADRIQPRDIAFFHGVIDLKKLNFGEKMIVKGFKAPTGDFRDWSVITAWAESIVESLRETVR